MVLTMGSAQAEPPTPTVRFTAAGDYGAGPNSVAVFDLIGNLNPDLNLALGDMSYGTTGQEQQWCDLVKSHVGEGFPFELLAGNHESNGINGNINDFSACLPNQLPGVVGTYGREYYVDVPAANPLVRFVMISPNLDFGQGEWQYTPGTAHYNWTTAAIDGARTKGVPWVVVGLHKPCISVGVGGCPISPALMDLLFAKKVDLIVSGDEHSYMRTHQIATGPGCDRVIPGTFNSACVRDTDGTFAAGAGSVWAIVGTGGVQQRDVSAADPEAGYFAAYSGANKDQTFGVLDVSATATRLTADFRPAPGGAGFTDHFVVDKSLTPPNQPPVAAAAGSCTQLACTFTSAGSSDPDGSITSVNWDFGDGTTGSGATAAHTYATAGTYTATVTVTDNQGATASAAVTVTATAAQTTVFASDDFDRTVAAGWGSAPIGGAWTVSSSTSTSVGSGAGAIRIPAGGGPYVTLSGASAPGMDLTLTLALDKLPAGGSGLYTYISARRMPTGEQYRAVVRVTPQGTVYVRPTRTTSTGAETALNSADTLIPGLTLQPNVPVRVRIQVVGAGPTTIRAKVWAASAAEPAAWVFTVTDTTAALQGPGSLRISTYLSGSTTNAPITLLVDNFRAIAPE